MDPVDQEKTAFTTGSGLWEFTVMPFGLTNAPATFQRLMDIILEGLTYTTCLVYLDDIIVHGETFEDLMQHLDAVLSRLRMAGLKLSPAKCHLCERQVKFLGHVVSETGIAVDPEKTAAVKDWPSPKNKKEVQSFLGLCAYYRRFILNFSALAKPLTALTEKRAEFCWTPSCQTAFNLLKEKLTSAPILSQPSESGPFIVDTDASEFAWGAVLSQVQDGQERVLEYYSKTFSRPERNYCVTRKELLAAVKGIRHFSPYLLGRDFTLRTDHASLRWLMSFKEPEGQIARWIEQLQQYNFHVQHRPGSRHANADALSRRPCEEFGCSYCARVETKQRLQICVTAIRGDMQDEQGKDPTLVTVREWVERGSRPQREEISSWDPTVKAYWAMFSILRLEDGLLCRKYSDGSGDHLQVLVPNTLQRQIIQSLHDGPEGGHFGIEKTLQKIRQRYYWVGSAADVEKYVLRCATCQRRKGPLPRTRARMQIYNVGAPFERVAIDILGPLPVTARDHKYILVAADYFTKWPEAMPLKDQTAESVAEALIEHVFSRFGVPIQLHSDQGRNFESTVFRMVMEKFGIDKTRTTALHPQSDGMVERFNRTILDYLSKYVAEHQRDWDEHLPFLLLAYRSSVHETTGMTPAMLTLGRELRLPAQLCRGEPPSTQQEPLAYQENLNFRLLEVHKYTRHRLEMKSRQMKHRYDLSSKGNPFKVGDRVLLYNPKRQKGRCPKLQLDWEGPYEISEVLTEVVYRIRKSEGNKSMVVHRDRLAPYLA